MNKKEVIEMSKSILKMNNIRMLIKLVFKLYVTLLDVKLILVIMVNFVMKWKSQLMFHLWIQMMMNEDKIKGIKAIVSYYNKVELLKEEIDKLKSIRESNTFIMTIFLAGENSVDNYTMSITSDNMMQNDYGVLYQDFIDKLIEGKEKELASYNMVLEKFSENLSIF